MQGSDTAALRKSATGLRYSGTALSGIAITYETMAAWVSAGKTDAATATKWRQMAKNYQQLGGSMITLAGTLDEQAAKQDAASSATGFTPPVLTVPQVPTSALDPSPSDPAEPGGDPIVDSPLPGPSSGSDLPDLSGGTSDDPLASTDDAIPGIGDAPGGADALGEALGPSAESASDPTTADQDGDQKKPHAEGPLNLLPSGSAVNVAVAGVAAAAVAGIAASVLRRRKPKNTDDWEDEEGDGDDVEAVYQAEPRQRPAAG